VFELFSHPTLSLAAPLSQREDFQELLLYFWGKASSESPAEHTPWRGEETPKNNSEYSIGICGANLAAFK